MELTSAGFRREFWYTELVTSLYVPLDPVLDWIQLSVSLSGNVMCFQLLTIKKVQGYQDDINLEWEYTVTQLDAKELNEIYSLLKDDVVNLVGHFVLNGCPVHLLDPVRSYFRDQFKNWSEPATKGGKHSLKTGRIG